MAADDAADSRRLAALAWRLYGEVGVIQAADIERLHGTPPGHVRAAAGWPGRSASTST